MKRIMVAVLLVAAIGSAASGADLPPFEEVRSGYRKSESVLLDRHGKPIHELRSDMKSRRLEWVGLNDISPALVTAVIRSEDKRFHDHEGVDWIALGAAALRNIFSSSGRGASTITMQLAAQLDKNLKPRPGAKRNISQKWDQIGAAREIDASWSKEQIIEAYLNLVSFRGELQGITAASRGLFSKEPSGLTESEAVILAALIRSPNAAAPTVAKRACSLAGSLGWGVTCPDLESLSAATLAVPYHMESRLALAPHAARRLMSSPLGSQRSTLDADLQRYAIETLNHRIEALRKNNVQDGALLVVDNRTGDILAYVGNAGAASSARHVDGIQARRQAGSTLKPFLYGLGIERRLFTAASLLDDSPVNVATGAGLYIPHNYDSDYRGLVSVRTALASSLNIPAVRTLMLIGPNEFVQRLARLGFTDLNDGEYYGLSMALGSVDISLFELVNAYRTLANNGQWSGLRLSTDKKTGTLRQVMQPEAAFIISDILSDRTARGLTFGYENPLATRFWSAVKTGTSKDMRDNWCVGYSQRYTVGVWIGNFSGSAMWNVSGISGAAPVWLDVMNYLHRSHPSHAPAHPADAVSMRVSFSQDIEPARSEWFVKGTEPPSPLVSTASAERISDMRKAILYPPADTIMALDPDIPEENQIVFLESSGTDKAFWVMDGKRLAPTSGVYPWKPASGRHELSIADDQGKIVDTVRFEVRGHLSVEADQQAEKRAAGHPETRIYE